MPQGIIVSFRGNYGKSAHQDIYFDKFGNSKCQIGNSKCPHPSKTILVMGIYFVL